MATEYKGEGDGAKGAADPTMEEILASIRKIIAEDGDGNAEESKRPAEVLDLTEMVAEDGSVVSLSPHAQPDTPFAGPALTPDPDPLDNFAVVDEPAPVAPPLPPPPPPPVTPIKKDSTMSTVPPADRLVSDTIASQARSAFAQVVHATRPRNQDGDARSVEQVVEDLLRPMLKEWLDTHLAEIVQRCVAEELARISGRDPNL